MDLITLAVAKKYARELVEGVAEILEGTGAEYYTLAPTTLSFRSTAPLDEFQEVQVNSETVSPENYTLEEGSTIVKFSIDYLKTLGTGSHQVAVVSANQTAKGGFTVKAPELNKYGFYYNQPYSAYVESFGGTTIFFLRDSGAIDVIGLGGYTETCSYAIDGNNIIINSALGTFTGYFTEEGIYCNEVATIFALNIEIIADNNYIYIYDEVLGGYIANPINDGQDSYAPIKTGINDNPTVKINDYAFSDNHNLISMPEIPNAVTIIGTNAFANCTQLKIVALPASLVHIESGAFYGCMNLTNIVFEGTCEQWNAVSKDGDYWNYQVPATHVTCSDGTVAL